VRPRPLRPAFAVLASAAAFALTTATACAPPASAPPSSSEFTLAPGARVHGASLLGTDAIGLPNGLLLTPDAAPGAWLGELDPHLPNAPTFRAGGAVATALSPDGRTLLVLTSGYNRLFDTEGSLVEPGSSEYVFVYDVAGGAPRERQVLRVPNAFGGLAFDPRGGRFYVGGGSDDVVRQYAVDGLGAWREDGAATPLGHLDAKGTGGLGVDVGPYAAGVAVSRSGAVVVVANHENDTLSVVDPAARRVTAEIRLTPGGGQVGGEFPASVVLLGEGRAFVTCQRDREVVEVDLASRKVVRRIRVGGQPTRIVANRGGTRLYVANANSDTVSVLDPSRGVVLASIATAAPKAALPSLAGLRGSNPNALALSPDERTLYVTNGGNSTLAVVALAPDGAGGEVVALVPTGFYPNAVTLSADGARVFVAHGKSPTGPNGYGPFSPIERTDPADGRRRSPRAGNQYSLQLTHGGLLSFPLPALGSDVLGRLTAQALANNRMTGVAPAVPPVLAALRGRVKHVIYVIGENRSYDQILGDLPGADGDRSLVHWGEAITPNQHALARDFVAFDRFFDAGGVSGDGWEWTVSGRTTDVAEKAIPVQYAERGHHSYDWEGTNRNVNVGLPTLAARLAFDPHTPPSADLVPGMADVGAVDGPAEGGRGALWDVALTAGRTFRNYGCFVDGMRYGLPDTDPARVLPLRAPAATRTRVAFPTRDALQATTDPYYRGFDMDFADYWRVEEWAREFRGYVERGDLPSLEMVRLPHDHLGSFDTAGDGLNTPDAQIADHDLALGRLVETLSRSPYWESTVVVALEDDAQNGSDHVDAHRSILFVAGGHVARRAKLSTPFTTVSVLRTIEILLDLPPLGQQDAVAPPLEAAFRLEPDLTPFVAKVPSVLRSSSLPLPPPGAGERASAPRGDRASWANATKGLDFTREDALPTARWNRIVACGLDVPAACESARARERRPVPPSRDDDD
jgi:YVTN family beta-propeller protein